MTIRKRGSKFVLVSSTGKTLGTHTTRAAAAKQERAVSISKARQAGHTVKKKRA
jgi:hypothetical protein